LQSPEKKFEYQNPKSLAQTGYVRAEFPRISATEVQSPQPAASMSPQSGPKQYRNPNVRNSKQQPSNGGIARFGY